MQPEWALGVRAPGSGQFEQIAGEPCQGGMSLSKTGAYLGEHPRMDGRSGSLSYGVTWGERMVVDEPEVVVEPEPEPSVRPLVPHGPEHRFQPRLGLIDGALTARRMMMVRGQSCVLGELVAHRHAGGVRLLPQACCQLADEVGLASLDERIGEEI